MLHYTESIVCVTVCYLIVMAGGILHIAFGAEFIKLGVYLRDHFFNDQQFYLDNLPLGAFTITIGGFMVLAMIGLRIVIRKKLGPTGELLVWMTNWLVCIFNFAVAMMEIREYVLQEQSFTKFGLPLPTVSQFTVPYYLELADGIFSFVIVFPVTLYLVYLSNFRMVESQLRNRLYIRPLEPVSKVEVTQEREVAVETE